MANKDYYYDDVQRRGTEEMCCDISKQ